MVRSPSLASTLKTTELNSEAYYLLDSAEPEDIRALYGTVQDPTDGTLRSWFPTQQNMDYCEFGKGEWTEAEEKWFFTRLDCIRKRTPQAKPLTAHQSSAILRRCRSRSATEALPNIDQMESLAAEYAELAGGVWNGASIHELESCLGND